MHSAVAAGIACARSSAIICDPAISAARPCSHTPAQAASKGGNPRARMAAIKAEREASQPLRVATGGSTFKNPPGDRKAWQLIDAAGCRGLRHGRAMVSEKHCNFLINTGAARAAEIEALGELVRARVLAECGVALEWEIHRIGRPDNHLEAAA